MDLQFLNTIFAGIKQNEYKWIGWQEATRPLEKDLYNSYDENNLSFDNLEECRKHIEKLEKDPTVISIWITPNSFLTQRTHAESMLGHIGWMFVDVDYTSVDRIKSWIDEFTADYNLYPSMIVNSGRGVQLYWKLTDAWQSDGWKNVQQGIRQYFQADHMVSRAGNYMRVPGTENRKYLLKKKRDEGYTNVYQCRLIENNDRIYAQSDFTALLPQIQHQAPAQVSNPFTEIKLMGKVGLDKIRQHCPVVDTAFQAIENNDASNTPGHQKRLLAASMIRHTVNNEKYVLDTFGHCDDFNPEITLKMYRSVNQKPITCQKLRSSEWDKMCSDTCPLMADVSKRSPIAFAYREGEQLELTGDLLKKTDNDAAFKELALRAKTNDNLLSRAKLIKQISVAFGIRETEIKQYMKELTVQDERMSYVVNGKIDEVKAAVFIIEKHRLIRYKEEFYCYREGIWERMSQEEVEALIHKEIRDYSSNHVISEVIQAVKRESLVTSDVVDAKQDTYVIACKNGLLDVRTKNLKEFEPEDYRFQKMNAAYVPNAKSPGFLKVVDDLFGGDPDSVEKKMLLQEIMGYLLIPDYTLVKKMFYFYGPKANNGKSTIIDIFYALMGEKYIDSVPLNKLDGFMLKRLAGKHANIVADQDAQTKVPDGVFKQLVGGRDWITADVKYKEAINFKNKARLIFAVNKLPYSQAKDAGYYTRIVTLVFNNKFVVNPDPNDKRQMKASPEKIDQIIEHELDGILIWALEGLDRLLVNQKLTIPKSSDEALDEYQKENNSVLLFVDETCRLGPAYSIDRTELYAKYTDWCDGNGFDKKVNARTFYKTLELELDIESKKSCNTRKLKGIQHSLFA